MRTAALERSTAPEGEYRRSEVTIAADAVWALFEAGLIPRSPVAIKKAALAAGVPIAALRDANERRARGYYEPPAQPPRSASWSTESRRRYADGVKRGAEAAAVKMSRQPRPQDETMECSACGNELSIACFPPRADRPGRLVTQCRTCRRAKARDRYLDVARRDALNRARITFVIVDDDVHLGLACADCGALFVAGDVVHGDARLVHDQCEARR